ncbi:hypothetical protein D9756_005928 [Leucocoprinus leucothites]|uniref:Mannosyltransferase n=1 Tax=Leucocoprinus leucothites TaxID=201217 RepID=A0A8H5FXC9_9AGAR|nr:hypothetical protein D9756_005928 [Leucoagaricus leucothites]
MKCTTFGNLSISLTTGMDSKPGKSLLSMRPAFFAVRWFLAGISTVAECAFYRAVASKVNDRVGRYLFFMMLLSAGMWNASTGLSAFLPSSFAMYTTAFAFSYTLEPATLSNKRRTLGATLFFALGAIVGWPFALAISIPFVFEELFVYGGDRVPPQAKSSWLIQRWTRFLTAVAAASLIFVPVVGIDSLAYGKLVIVPWNIVKYNIFGGSERGPDLYGTSPWHFYINNLLLNFNYLLPLSLFSLPALAVTYIVDRKRLGFISPTSEQSSPFTLLALRLAPFYLWLAILTAQAHKEERFMFPAYPLLCFNAAVTLYLMRGWMEVVFIKVTKSPYQASQTLMFRNFTLSLVVGTAFLSLCRIRAQWVYYHAPLSVLSNFGGIEIPQLLNSTGLLPVFPPGTREEDIPPVDITPVKHFDLVLCLGKEWHRFAGHYLVPTGVRVEFIKSDFRGQLPRHFNETADSNTHSDSWWLRPETSYVPTDVNDLNKEDTSRYVQLETCDYLIDLDYPVHPAGSPLEPRYATDPKRWERAICEPFLDPRHSSLLTRALWLPGEAWQLQNEFGDYCILKNVALVKGKQERLAAQITAMMVTNPSQLTPRPLPSSPSLMALLELIPPSPILSPSDLTTSTTSGEIPIFLFKNTSSATVPFDEQDEPCLLSLDSSPRSWEFNLSRSTLLIANHGSNGSALNVSSTAISDEHACTGFDAFQHFACQATRRRPSLCWTSNTLTGDFIRDGKEIQDQWQDGNQPAYYEDSWIGASQWGHALPSLALSEEDRSEAHISALSDQEFIDEPHLPIAEGTSLRDPILADAQSVGYNCITLTSPSTSDSFSSLPKESNPLSATQDDSYPGEISSIEFCTGETSTVPTLGSASSLSRRPAIYRACGSPKYRKEFQIPNLTGDVAVFSKLEIPNVETTTRPGDTIAIDREIGIDSAPGGSPDPHFSVVAHKLPSPSRSPFTPLLSQHPQSLSPQTCTTKPTSTPRVYPHRQYPWLQNVTLSLVIDQEGFRTVQPSFRRAEVSRRCLVDTGNTEVDVVTFIPTKREVFRFHYAPFDGLPILRRLIVNSDESRDFLSRQAYLGLKTSGMYTVHGTEIASPSVATPAAGSSSLSDNIETSQALDSNKLYWQFDYSVEDRRVEQAGRIKDGEKILVPLTFACSPRLLHPNQGKKIKLIQIVKKTVVPKLTAERKPAPSLYPTIPRAPTAAPPVPNTVSSPPWKANVIQHATPLYFNKSQAWNLHRRSQSNPREVPRASLSPPPKTDRSSRHRNYESTDSPSIVNGSSNTTPISIPRRRRRASSAGESHVQPRTGISPIRHILPPSRLRQLLEEASGGEQETVEDPVSEIPSNRLVQDQPLDFFPLKPSPRFRN